MAKHQTIRRTRIAFAVIFILYVPVCFYFALVARRWTDSFVPAFMLAGVWMSAFLVTGLLPCFLRCPECECRLIGHPWRRWVSCKRCGFQA